MMNFSKGHCCEGKTLTSIQINIGDHLYQNGDEVSYLEIKQIIIHPDYESGWYDSVPYDFCMVQTKEKMVIDGVKTQVACFPEAGIHADGNEAECWTAGWGMVSFGWPEDPLQLQTLKVNLYDDEICYNHALNHEFFKNFNNTDDFNNTVEYDYAEVPPFPDYVYYGNYSNNNTEDYSDQNTEDHWFYNSEVEFCAGHYNMTTDTYTEDASSCYGDSGGPLGTDRRSYISLRGVS